MGAGKNPLVSRTLLFNALLLIVLVANPFGFKDLVPDEFLEEYAAAIITAINLLLRFVTKEPLNIGKLFGR